MGVATTIAIAAATGLCTPNTSTSRASATRSMARASM